MDRRKFPVSVVPYPIDKAPNFDKISGPKSDEQDDSAAWDAKWLRPNLTLSSAPPPKAEETPTSQPKGRDSGSLRANRSQFSTPAPKIEERATPEEKKTEPEEPPRSLLVRLLHWLFPDVNQRRARRYSTPGLVAYYWTGGTAYSYQVGDMSATGLFLLTKEKWAPGTLIQMTLQQREGPTASNNYLCVLSEVVRWGENGTGCNFVLSDYESVGDFGVLPGDAIDRKSVERFLQRICTPGRT